MFAWVKTTMLLAYLAFSLLLQRANKIYESLPELNRDEQGGELPSLSIIIPARNEAENLRRLLPSLRAGRYGGEREIIVVDDDSSDETAVVAREYGARVIRVNELPSGWLGKPHACHVGASDAKGAWLLFVDADTEHAPQSTAAAVGFAVEHDLDGLSLMPQNDALGPPDGIALAVAFAALFAGRRSAAGLLNGQFILLRSDVYWKSGGHAAVSLEAMEDLALGRRLREQGYVTPLARAEGLLSVRMYQDYQAWWLGLSRWGSRSIRTAGAGAVVTGLLITAAMYPLLLLLRAARGRLRWEEPVAAWVIVAFNLLPWARRFGEGWWAVLAPLGALLVQIAATWGLLRDTLWQGTSWKDRII